MNLSDERIRKLLGRFFSFPLPNYPCSHYIFIQLTSILILLGYDLEIPV